MKYEKGMIISKKEYTDSELTFCRMFVTLFILWIFFGGIAWLEINQRNFGDCVPVSDKACLREIHPDQEKADLVKKVWLLGIVGLGILSIGADRITGTKYQLTINSQEEFDKQFPKRLSDREQRKMILAELAEIKAMLIKRGRHK